jgi:hypothetical protein
MAKGKKILILGSENCGLIYNLSKGLKSIGDFIVTTAVWQKDPFFPQHKYDIILERPSRTRKGIFFLAKHIINLIKWKIKYKLFNRGYLSRYDIYIFTWQTFHEDLTDLAILKKNNKKVVFLFIGSDIRWIEAFHQEFPSNPYKGQEIEDWVKKIRLLRMAELYCSSIFSMPDMSTLIIRGYYHMFMPIDFNRIKFSPQSRIKPLIIHAPSKRDIKGTGIILSAIEELKKQGIEFEFELLEKVGNEVVLKKLQDADIVVDQLFLNGPGTLATEGMAAGCAIATRFLTDNKLTGNAPFCYVDENCLLQNLKKLIQDVNYRTELIRRGKEFVMANNSSSVIASRILESLERDKQDDFDYTPTFFKESFILPKKYNYPLEIEELNKKVLEMYS